MESSIVMDAFHLAQESGQPMGPFHQISQRPNGQLHKKSLEFSNEKKVSPIHGKVRSIPLRYKKAKLKF